MLGDASLVVDLLIEQNAGNGIRGSTEGSIIQSSRIRQNGGDGISLAFVFASPGTVIRDCAITENHGDGVEGDRLAVIGNNVTDNGGLGLQLNFLTGDSGFTNNLITGNNGGSAQPQTSGGNQMGTNVCGFNPTCP